MSIEDIPVEILCHTFFLLQSVYPVLSFEVATAVERQISNHNYPGWTLSISIAQRMLGWINVTFVSQRWRNAALSTPYLWARITHVLGRNWTETFIERSQSAIIEVYFGDPVWLNTKTVAPWLSEALLSNFTRTRSLTVYFQEVIPRDIDSFYTLVKHGSNQLVAMNLNRPWTSIGRSVLTSTQYPRLRSLTLGLPHVKSREFPWRDIETLQLMELDVQFAVHPMTASAFTAFMRVLSRLPSLRRLRFACYHNRARGRLEGVSCFCSTFVVNPRLLDLEHLELGSPSRTVFHILQHIQLPMSTKISLTLDPVFDKELFEFALAPLLSSIQSNSPYQQASLGRNHDTDPTAWRIFAARSLVATLDTVDLKLYVHEDDVASSLDALIALSRDTVQSLDVDFWPSLSDSPMIAKLSSFDQVSRIRIAPGDIISKEDTKLASEALAAVLQRLLMPFPHIDGSSPNVLPFPKLTTLDLRDIQFNMVTASHGTEEAPQTGSWTPVSLTLEHILDSVLNARREAGALGLNIFLDKEWEHIFANYAEKVDGPKAQFVSKKKRVWMSRYDADAEFPGVPPYLFLY